MQGLALVNWVLAGESDLSRQLDRAGFHPHRYWFNDQYVVGLQLQIRARRTAPNVGEIYGNHLGPPRIPVDYLVAGDFRLPPICRILQTAAGTNQVAHVHRGLQRIPSRGFDSPIDTDDLLGAVRGCLQLESSNERLQNAITARRQIEHEDLITRT